MKQGMRLLFVIGALAWPAAGAGVEGSWLGTLEAGAVRLRLVLHLAAAPGGALTGSVDSLDQGAMGIPVRSVTVRERAFAFEVPTIQGSYSGTLSADGSQIAGEWKQSGISLPLTFQRSEKVPRPARPQEPKRPYPYEEQEVAYANKAGGVRLGGTLTLPRAAGPHPAVLLITGSGAQDRDEALYGHRPFLVLADYLTRRGIAVLRVDDRGVGKSSGKTLDSTNEDLASDVLAGVEFLKSRKEIDARRIGLVGHSEGGLVAPVAANGSTDVAFVVLIAAPAIPGEKLLYLQSEAITRVLGLPEEMARRNQQMQRALFEAIRQEKDPAAAEERMRAEIARLKTGLPEDQRRGIEALQQRVESQLPLVNSRWFRAFIEYDPGPALRKLKSGVLAVSGELDVQVPPKENLPALIEALEAGGNRDYTIAKLPGLNHLLQTAQTGSPAEYAKIEETIAPAALDLLGDWILRRFR
jgi:pimeloyl-ACP methyl ester carboxylesterase